MGCHLLQEMVNFQTVRGFNSAVITAVLIFIACWDFLNFCFESILTIFQTFEKSYTPNLSTADARYLRVDFFSCVKAFSHDKPKSYNGSFDDLLTMFYVFFLPHLLHICCKPHHTYTKCLWRRTQEDSDTNIFSIFKTDLRRHRPEYKRTKESREKTKRNERSTVYCRFRFFFFLRASIFKLVSSSLRA